MRLRTAFFAPLLATGGTQRHLQQVLALLDRSRFDPHVYTLKPGGEVEAELQAAGVPVTCLRVGTRLGSPRSVMTILRTARRLRRERVAIVHGYQWRPALVGSLVGRLAGAPLLLASKRSLTGSDTRARHAWRRIARRVDTILVNADALRVEGESQGMRARWALLQNGIDADRFRVPPPAAASRAAMGLDPVRAVVGTVGRLEHRKGQDQLLAALARMQARAGTAAPQLLLVGDGPTRSALERQAAELGVARDVRFAGNLADVRPALAAMDVFVLPSREEGMSNALMEAMVAERPVVATAVGGNGELVTHDGTGVLVAPGDVDAMAHEVLMLLESPSRAARLTAAARAFVTSRFGAPARVAELERLYQERLEARVRRAA